MVHPEHADASMPAALSRTTMFWLAWFWLPP
jgi:hypothetical protein